jgi:hypothetical protein
MVGAATLVLMGLGPAALAGGPIHDPDGRGFPVLSAPPVGGLRVDTAATPDDGWIVQGATVAVLALAVLVCLLAWAGRRQHPALPRPR